MEVKGQFISTPDPSTCPDRKYKERMAELQERRRGLQALLSTRVAELKRVCLQEAELTGALPSDFPLEAGEKPPSVPRRRGTSRQANRKCQTEEEYSQRSKSKKTLFSGALRKHSDPEHNTHTHHGKRTVHRGCHTDDTVRSESSSTSDSTGLENDDSVSAPLLVSSGSPVKVFFQNKTTRNALHIRTDHPETLQTYKPLHPSHLPTPPPRSWDSSSGPSNTGGVRFNAACHSNSSDGHLDRINPLEDSGLMVSGETLPERPTRVITSNGLTERTEVGRWRGGGYSEVLLDYVWGKQRQLQPNSQHLIPCNYQLLFNGYSSQQPLEDPPTYRTHLGDQRRVRVTRTKSCGPFLPLQKGQADTQDFPLSAIQPDPHPYLLPPRPPQLPPVQDVQLEETTRSLHKTLALEGLRDWYLRNTKGSAHKNLANGKMSAGAIDQVGGGGALQSNLRNQAVFQQSTYWTEKSQHHTMAHSSTFHGQPLQGRSMEAPLYHNSFPPHTQEDQPSPGTLV
ncbi:coiled-coil domain-containing protein 120 [Pungitius pungitius]|uniref:coiled-coil domain-containing protein 120 n=1 Tax=Pungitius pungitius TaxID=134920 RepID=UPI002E119FB7